MYAAIQLLVRRLNVILTGCHRSVDAVSPGLPQAGSQGLRKMLPHKWSFTI